MNKGVRRKGGHMKEWVCFKCGNEIDFTREYYGFDENRRVHFHTAPCPITMEEEEQGVMSHETMNQAFSID
jgi:hypothetical protein